MSLCVLGGGGWGAGVCLGKLYKRWRWRRYSLAYQSISGYIIIINTLVLSDLVEGVFFLEREGDVISSLGNYKQC